MSLVVDTGITDGHNRVNGTFSVAKSATDDPTMTRTLSPSLAPIVAELELEARLIVTMEGLTDLARAAGVRSDVKHVAERLRESGWLLPTTTIGVWEFAPGAHAGPIGHGHPFIDFLAALAARDIPGASVCLGSALWAHGLVDRPPERIEVAVAPRVSVPAGLGRAARAVTFAGRLEPVRRYDVPVHQPITILVHLATRPTDVRSWGSVEVALPALVDGVRSQGGRLALEVELAGRPESVRRRLGYLVQALDSELAEHLVPVAAGKVWFGPRGPLKRHNQRFQIADTVLPFDPARLTDEATNDAA